MPDNTGPYTHTWTPSSDAPRSLQLTARRPVGRWPGLVPLWRRATGAAKAIADRPRVRWLLYGHTVDTTWTFPTATASWEISGSNSEGWAASADAGAADAELDGLYNLLRRVTGTAEGTAE